ncbi:MAG TPA: ACT domain-containing protein [bacterium]|nr:ACT domain-containing protein [bacterium]HPN46078.1 ACT domain-containing protein [bacterium]
MFEKIQKPSTEPKRKFKLLLLSGEFGIVKLAADEKIPEWALKSEFYSITRTAGEMTVVCDSRYIPADYSFAGDWKCLKLEGVYDLNETGVIAALSDILAKNGISIFVVSTWPTDYILLRQQNLVKALFVLQKDGHTVLRG